MAVYSMYESNSSSFSDLLTNIKNALVDKGWVVDEDDITNNLSLSVHVNNSNCYFTIRKLNAPYYDTKFLCIEVNTGFKTGQLFKTFSIYEAGYSTYYDLHLLQMDKAFIFANSKHCIVIQYGNLLYNPDLGNDVPNKTDIGKFCLFYSFGQLDIPVSTLQGNYYIGVSGQPHYIFGGDTYPTQLWPLYIFLTYYENSKTTFTFGSSGNFPWFKYGRKVYEGGITNYGIGEPASHGYPIYTCASFQFSRLHLFSVPLFSYYTPDGNVYYRHPIAESPFYFCKYLNSNFFNRTITYNSRVFKVYPIDQVFANGIWGIAIEVDNVTP